MAAPEAGLSRLAAANGSGSGWDAAAVLADGAPHDDPFWVGPCRCFRCANVRTNAARMALTHDTAHEDVARLRLPGVLLGIGLGGFVDGIVLHQILQWHHMLTSEGSYPSTTVAGLETNTLWDGLFHAATWIAVAAGLWIFWRRTTDLRWAISGRAFVGWMLVGWGLFNLVEGAVDHHVLGIHHVRTGDNETLWDLAFLGFGAVLLIGGLLARSDQQR
jgi:uncharacterized membrane protein